jgi:dethiobiotin synthetase
MRGFFITGTDTDCGKTTISLGIMAALQRRGLRVLGMKPVAAGCFDKSPRPPFSNGENEKSPQPPLLKGENEKHSLEKRENENPPFEKDIKKPPFEKDTKKPPFEKGGLGGFVHSGSNADALHLLAQGSSRALYEHINPYAFAPPIAPHLAAAQIGVTIELRTILTAYKALAAQADVIIVEGAGGWRVPLAPNLFLSDLALALELPVILIVGLKLGCLNHAVLTVESICASGAPLHGWIGTQIDAHLSERDGNLATLRELITAPCLGVIPWLKKPTPQRIANYLRIEC